MYSPPYDGSGLKYKFYYACHYGDEEAVDRLLQSPGVDLPPGPRLPGHGSGHGYQAVSLMAERILRCLGHIRKSWE